INTGAVIVGSAVGLTFGYLLQPRIEVRLRRILGVLVIYAGFSTTVKSLGKTGFSHLPKEIFIVFISLILGNAIGMFLRLQTAMNRVGEYARKTMSNDRDSGNRFSEGSVTCT